MTIREILESVKLDENFTLLEFANTKDGFAVKMPDYTLVRKLQTLRSIVGSINITSGYRTPTFNASVGGSPTSYHMQGLAVDCRFDFSGWNRVSLVKLFQSIGFTNVNFYLNKNGTLNRVHLDVGKTWNGQAFNYRDIKL
jgi:uncharacterized protein YcbK (DUF882 family)